MGAIAGTGPMLSCSPDSPLTNVPPFPSAGYCAASETNYENFGAAFFANYCLRCHSVTLANDLTRIDAPIGVDFDSIVMAREFKNRIRMRAGLLGDMPPRILPVPRPSESERIQLIEWIDCGMRTKAEQAAAND